jgi:surface polysaccharide O-acyltransferase-like enzyme
MTPMPTRKLPKQRLIGIDLFRGVAAYAVAVIHANAVMTYSGFSTDNWMVILTQLSRFAVPFFLAASFYLMTAKIYNNENNFSFADNFKSRFTRLLVPYLCWSAIYIFLRSLQSLNTPDGPSKLFQDPVRLIFLGGSSFHLYFLPLLFIGSFLIIVAAFLAKKHIQIKQLFFLLAFSLVIYESLILSGNAFELGTYCFEGANSCSIAFQELTKIAFPNGNNNQLLRLLLVIISWLLQCLPYALIGMILNYPSVRKNLAQFNQNHVIIFMISLVIFSALGVLKAFQLLNFPQALYEVGAACSLLLCGITLSKSLNGSRIVENLGACAFGIYLMHHLLLLPYVKIGAKLPNEIIGRSPAMTMIVLASLSFVTSWIITSLLLKKKPISKLLFGT